MVVSISFFRRSIPSAYRYLSRGTIYTLSLYYYSAVEIVIIEGSKALATSISFSLIVRSISPVTPSLRRPEIAPFGVYHSLVSLIYSGNPAFLLAIFIANKRSSRTTDFSFFSRVKSTLRSTIFNPFLGANSFSKL